MRRWVLAQRYAKTKFLSSLGVNQYDLGCEPIVSLAFGEIQKSWEDKYPELILPTLFHTSLGAKEGSIAGAVILLLWRKHSYRSTGSPRPVDIVEIAGLSGYLGSIAFAVKVVEELCTDQPKLNPQRFFNASIDPATKKPFSHGFPEATCATIRKVLKFRSSLKMGERNNQLPERFINELRIVTETMDGIN